MERERKKKRERERERERGAEPCKAWAAGPRGLSAEVGALGRKPVSVLGKDRVELR